MASSSKKSEKAARPRGPNGRFISRSRPRKDRQPTDAGDSKPSGPPAASGRSSQTVEELGLLSLALLCGLIGLAIHVVWLVSIVVMAVLLGLTAARLRRTPGGGLVGEALAEVKVVAAEITAPDSDRDSSPLSTTVPD